MRKKWLYLVVGAVVVLVLGFVGIPYVYIHFFDKTQSALTVNSFPTTSSSPDPVSSATTSTATTATTGDQVSLDGTWTVASGSAAGYRVQETLNGQSHTATGRTSAITGSLTVAGGSVTKGSFAANLSSVSSDRAQRDNQFEGRIMDVSQYPTASFTITSPITLGATPADGAVVTRQVTGSLTLHGTTKTVTFTVSIKKTGATIVVSGDIPISFAGYNIPNPSFPPFVTTADNGILEFTIGFTHA